MRIVKGANLAMEHVDAELQRLAAAPYATKAEVDASYKRLLDRLLDAGVPRAVRVGVASHNLFDVAWALGATRRARPRRPRSRSRCSRGWRPPQARAVRPMAGGCCCTRRSSTDDDFAAAIAYLARRLDENTAPENFLPTCSTSPTIPLSSIGKPPVS